MRLSVRAFNREALAGIRISYYGEHRQSPAGCASAGARPPSGQLFYFFFEAPYAVTRAAPSDFQHRFSGAAPSYASGEAGKPGVFFGQAWERVFQLCQLDLEFAVAAACALGEDVEDQLRAVDRLESGHVLKGARLCGFQIDIEDGDIGAAAHGGQGDALQPSLSDDSARVDLSSRQLHYFGDFDSCGPDQFDNFRPGGVARRYGKHQRAFFLGVAGAFFSQARKLAFERVNFGFEVEIQQVDIARLDPAERLAVSITVGARDDVGKLDFSGTAVLLHLDHGHEIEPEQG